jgi:hypothetical protein
LKTLKRCPGRQRLSMRVTRNLFPAVLLLASAGLASAQPHLWHSNFYPHHNFTFALGDAKPKGDLAPYFVQRPIISAGYGYRFHRYFQADVGLDVVFGAAHVEDYLETDFGPLRIRDRQFFVPFGGRAILPVFDGRLLISGGGGGAYMRYSELLRQPASDFRIDCPVCLSRDGWGYYALADVSFYLDRDQHFRLGAVAKTYRGHTEGESISGVPARTKDRWLNILGQVGFSF